MSSNWGTRIKYKIFLLWYIKELDNKYIKYFLNSKLFCALFHTIQLKDWNFNNFKHKKGIKLSNFQDEIKFFENLEYKILNKGCSIWNHLLE